MAAGTRTGTPTGTPMAAGLAPQPALPMPSDRWAAHLPAPGSFRPSQLTEGGGITRTWADRWAAAPDAPVLRVEGDGEGEGRWWRADALEEATRRAARSLWAAGLAPGERLVWSTATSFAGIVAALGALRLGAVVVPANAAYTERELGHIVRDVRPSVAVVDRAEHAAWLSAGVPGLGAVLSPDLRPLGRSGSAGGRQVAGPARSAAGADRPGGREEPVLDQAAGADPALVVYTSGTTGAPKGAVLSHGNLLAGARSLGLAWRWEPGDRLVLSLPLFHVHGLGAGLFGSLCAGASMVVVPRFEPEVVLDTARDRAGSLFFGVPTMYHRLLGSGRSSELARLRLCVSGSAALPAPLWRSLRTEGGVAVLERYGMTETMLTVSNPYDGERRPGTVGFPLPGVEVRLDRVDAGDGPPGALDGPTGGAPDGDRQMLVAGPSVFAGYWERPAANEAAFDGRWFRTGDVVGADADGYLSLRGRRQDLVISGGFNVYPTEVEDVLLSHPDVAEAAVAGEPSEEWGQTVVAWIVPAGETPSLDSLGAFAAARLAPYKRPRRYRVVDSLPRNAMGKLQRSRLAE